jgi:hypothetical protein
VPPRLGEILVQEGACAPGAVREALQNQVIFGGRLGTNLLELGAVREEALAAALGRRFGVPALYGDIRLDPHAVALLKPEVADRCDAVPYLLADRKLAVLVVDPSNLAILDEVAFVSGRAVHPIVVPEARLWALLRSAYGVERQLRGLDVDFARLREASSSRGAPAAPAAVAADLMGEEDFDAIYAKTAPYALAPAPPEPAAGGSAAPPPPAEPRPPAAPPAPPAAAAPPAPAPPRAPAAAPPPRAAPPPAPVARAAPPAPPPAPPEDDVVELTDLLEPEPPPLPVPASTQELLAALYGRAAHAPPPTLARRPPPAPPRPEPEPSPLSFDEAVRFLEGVQDRGAIAHTVLRYARSKFRRALLVTVNRGVAHGWAGFGERLGGQEIGRVRIPLGAPGILDTVVRTRAHLLGPIPKTEANVRLLKQLGGGVPANAFVVPILALGRVVNLFYVDGGKGQSVDAAAIGELLILATRIAKSYDALLSRVR